MIAIISTGALFFQIEEDHDDDHLAVMKLTQKGIDTYAAQSDNGMFLFSLALVIPYLTVST